MKRDYRFGVALFVLLLINSSGIYAQKLQVNGNFLLGLPQGEFNDNVKNTGYGLGGYFAYPIGETPFMAGLDIGVIHYGEDTPEALNADESDSAVGTETPMLERADSDEEHSPATNGVESDSFNKPKAKSSKRSIAA